MCPKNYMNLPFIRYKNLGGTFVRFVTIHACDGQTDGQTDTFAVGKTVLHICSAVKIIIYTRCSDVTNFDCISDSHVAVGQV